MCVMLNPLSTWFMAANIHGGVCTDHLLIRNAGVNVLLRFILNH